MDRAQPRRSETARWSQLPNGQVFNTITNGYPPTMMGYGAQIPAADRWAIVAYVRALERSQIASVDDQKGPQ